MVTRLLLVLLLLVALPLGAQQEPRRPKLAEGLDPNDWRSYFLTGLERINPGGKDAIPYFQWAHRLSPASPEPLHAEWVAHWLGNLSLFARDVKPGARWWDKVARIDSLLYAALEVDPFTARNHTRLIYDAMGVDYDGELFTRGFVAYTTGHYAQAVQLLREPAAKGAAARTARYFRALSFYQMQRFDSAAAEMLALAGEARRDNARQTGRVYDAPALYEFAVARALVRGGDLAGARLALGRALEEDLSLAAAHALLGQIAQQQGRPDEMVTEWTTAAELRPGHAFYADGLGTALRAAGRYEAAAAAYERAVALAPEWAAPRWNLALALEDLDRKADAAKRYAEFVEMAPQAYESQKAMARGKITKLTAGR